MVKVGAVFVIQQTYVFQMIQHIKPKVERIYKKDYIVEYFYSPSLKCPSLSQCSTLPLIFPPLNQQTLYIITVDHIYFSLI